jgi:hypothetical protein
MAAGVTAAGLAVAFKLILAAQDGWRAVNAPPVSSPWHVPGALFVNGKVVEHSEDQQTVTPPIETAA